MCKCAEEPPARLILASGRLREHACHCAWMLSHIITSHVLTMKSGSTVIVSYFTALNTDRKEINTRLIYGRKNMICMLGNNENRYLRGLSKNQWKGRDKPVNDGFYFCHEPLECVQQRVKWRTLRSSLRLETLCQVIMETWQTSAATLGRVFFF